MAADGKSPWLSVESAVKRVSELLTESGLPLELRAAALMAKFKDECPVNDETYEINSGREIYSVDDDDEVVRELDQVLSIYEMLDEPNLSIHLHTTS
jgi:hypothetical protein